ncbi:Transcription initiation factor TFIID subunit 12 [Borealophlyctis nickersoniae]|nr:Transcription initiation factor TFIID subunit 12 [Borealophlyctis nickersoniae]
MSQGQNSRKDKDSTPNLRIDELALPPTSLSTPDSSLLRAAVASTNSPRQRPTNIQLPSSPSLAPAQSINLSAYNNPVLLAYLQQHYSQLGSAIPTSGATTPGSTILGASTPPPSTLGATGTAGQKRLGVTGQGGLPRAPRPLTTAIRPQSAFPPHIDLDSIDPDVVDQYLAQPNLDPGQREGYLALQRELALRRASGISGSATASRAAVSYTPRGRPTGAYPSLGSPGFPHLRGPFAPDAVRGDMRSQPVLSKEKMRLVVSQIDSLEKMDADVEEMMLEVADEFIRNVTERACKLVRHRGSDTLEAKDAQLPVEMNYDIRVPGFGDELNDGRKRGGGPMKSASHIERVKAIREAMREGLQGKGGGKAATTKKGKGKGR